MALQKWSGSGLTLGILKASGAQPFRNMMKYYHLHDIEEGRVCIGSNSLNITSWSTMTLGYSSCNISVLINTSWKWHPGSPRIRPCSYIISKDALFCDLFPDDDCSFDPWSKYPCFDNMLDTPLKGPNVAPLLTVSQKLHGMIPQLAICCQLADTVDCTFSHYSSLVKFNAYISSPSYLRPQNKEEQATIADMLFFDLA